MPETITKSNKDEDHAHRQHLDPGSESVGPSESAVNLKSTDKGAKKCRAGVILDRVADVEEEDEEANFCMNSGKPPAPFTSIDDHLSFERFTMMVRVKPGGNRLTVSGLWQYEFEDKKSRSSLGREAISLRESWGLYVLDEVGGRSLEIPEQHSFILPKHDDDG